MGGLHKVWDGLKAVLDLYDRVVDRELLIRRVNITARDLIPEDAVPEGRPVQLDMFTDYDAIERENHDHRLSRWFD